jgi:hypothetical protein
MATVTVTPGYNWVSGEVVTPAKMNLAAEPAVSVSAIVDADVAAGAAIAASKLSTAAQQALLPAGAVMAFAKATAPSGWLIANGNAVPNGSGTVQGVTADFSALYAAVGTSFSATAGTLPDLQGIFVRGSGSQTISGTAYSGTFASKQADIIKNHTHVVQGAGMFNGGTGFLYSLGSLVGLANYYLTPSNITSDNNAGGDASETRPANIALLYCIKF